MLPKYTSSNSDLLHHCQYMIDYPLASASRAIVLLIVPRSKNSKADP